MKKMPDYDDSMSTNPQLGPNTSIVRLIAGIAAVVKMSCFDQLIKLLSGERQCLILFRGDFLDFLRTVFFDPTLFDAEEKECDDPLVLVVPRRGRTAPCLNPAAQGSDVEL